jgi:hypothetical protein
MNDNDMDRRKVHSYDEREGGGCDDDEGDGDGGCVVMTIMHEG